MKVLVSKGLLSVPTISRLASLAERTNASALHNNGFASHNV